MNLGGSLQETLLSAASTTARMMFVQRMVSKGVPISCSCCHGSSNWGHYAIAPVHVMVEIVQVLQYVRRLVLMLKGLQVPNCLGHRRGVVLGLRVMMRRLVRVLVGRGVADGGAAVDAAPEKHAWLMAIRKLSLVGSG